MVSAWGLEEQCLCWWRGGLHLKRMTAVVCAALRVASVFAPHTHHVLLLLLVLLVFEAQAQDGYMYQLIEAPDITLGCLTKPGVQNWVLGLVRAKSFLPSPQWQQIGGSEAGNPTVIPAIKQGCYIQYVAVHCVCCIHVL